MVSGLSVYKDRYDVHVFITSDIIEGGYFFVSQGGISLITTTGWEKYFSLASIFEYLFHSILCVVVYAFTEDIDNHSNFTTGCQFDYTRLKDHARVGIALGYVCDDHKWKIREQLGETVLDDILMLFSFSWIGNTEETGSISHKMLDIFGLDLKRDSGYKEKFWERVQNQRDTLWFDFLKEIFKGVILIFVAFLLIKFGLKNP